MIVGNEPGVRPRPTGNKHRSLGGIEVAENKLKLVNGGGYQNHAFADGSALKLKNGLHRMVIARVGSQPPNSLRGIGYHPA